MAEPVEKKSGGCGKRLAFLTVILLVFGGGPAAFVGYHIRSSIEQMKIGSATGDIGAFNSALELYQKDVDSRTYPTDFRQLLVDNSAGWLGPYIATISPDPWGNEYSYQSDGHDYTLLSVHEPFFCRVRAETVRYVLSEGKISLLP